MRIKDRSAGTKGHLMFTFSGNPVYGGNKSLLFGAFFFCKIISSKSLKVKLGVTSVGVVC